LWNKFSDKYLTAPADSSVPTVTSLQRALDTANNRIASYERANDEHQRLQAVYEDTLTEATERIRNYVYQQNDYITSIHKHYTKLLQEARGETVQAQQIHQDWQRSLSKLNEELRRAVQAREEEKNPFTRKVSALKEENRVLRGLAGWEPADEDSSDEEEEVEIVTAAETRGRGIKDKERVVGNAMGQTTGKWEVWSESTKRGIRFRGIELVLLRWELSVRMWVLFGFAYD
jgi:chromosome segregation ATPase